MAARLIIKTDRVASVVASVKSLLGKEALVGIPEETSEREAVDGEEEINNATIGYLMETGIPSHNVPARPSLIPGVEASLPETIPMLETAAKFALDGAPAKADAALSAAGMTAADRVKDTIQSNIPPPLAPSTIRGRKRSRKTKSRRKDEQQYLTLIGQGMAPGDAQSAAGIVALVNTGKFRNSITSVVRKKT